MFSEVLVFVMTKKSFCYITYTNVGLEPTVLVRSEWRLALLPLAY